MHLRIANVRPLTLWRRLGFVSLFLLTGTLCSQEVTDWQKKAVAEFPEIAVKDSFLNRAFVTAYKEVQTRYPEFLKDPKLPYTLATALKLTRDKAAPGDAVEHVASQALNQLLATRQAGGFLGVSWGTSRADTRNAITARGNLSESSLFAGNPEVLLYEGGDYAGVPTKNIKFMFTGDRLMIGDVTIDASGGQQIRWSQVLQGLTQKYGPPTEIRQDKFNAGQDLLEYRWYLPAATRKKETIECSKNKVDGEVSISYTNEQLTQESIDHFNEQDRQERQQELEETRKKKDREKKDY